MSYSKIKKTYGLVLSEANSGDYDKVITILTSNMGKVTAFAKGSRRPKSVLLAPTQVFSFSNFVLYEGNTMFYINSADIVDVFYNIRFDYSKMEIGFKILKILKAVSPENVEVYNYLKLGVLTLNYLAKSDKDPEFVYHIFIARLLYEMGLGLNILSSKKSENEKKEDIKKQEKENKKNKEKIQDKFAVYNENLGMLKEYRYESEEEKEEIRNKYKKKVLNINVLNAVKYIYTSQIDNIFNFNLEEDAKKQFVILMKNGFKKHINIKV